MHASAQPTMPALALVIMLLAAPGLRAGVDACGVDRNAGSHALDEFTWKRLNSIHEEVGEARYDDAYADLRAMLERAGRETYLQAILHLSLAQVEWARENFDAALEHFEQAVDLNVLPDAQHFGLMYQIAQLYFMQGRYAEALDRLELWFCKAPPGDVTAHAHVLSASIHAQMGNHGAVLKAIDIAIAMEADPRESWYQLKLAAHYELRQYRPAAGTLEVMIDRWPEKKTYWRQLSQIHVTLENEDRALAVMALAYRNGLLDEASDITYLSSLYSHHDIPYKAAQVLEAGIRDGVVEADSQHWTRVADGWYAADEVEKALAAYAEAGKLADDGNLDLRRGYLLVDLERWPEADEALGRALAKGGLNEQKTGEALLLRGMTRFALGRHDAAAEDWARAGTYERTRDSARQWMNYLREERRRNSS